MTASIAVTLNHNQAVLLARVRRSGADGLIVRGRHVPSARKLASCGLVTLTLTDDGWHAAAIGPPCLQGMGCLCARHVTTETWDEPCDPTEPAPRPGALPGELVLYTPPRAASATEVARLSADDVRTIVEALNSHAYWQLAEEDNRRDGFVIDEDASEELRECIALHDRLEKIAMRMPRDG